MKYWKIPVPMGRKLERKCENISYLLSLVILRVPILYYRMLDYGTRDDKINTMEIA